MKTKTLITAAAAAFMAAAPAMAELFIPSLTYRSGPYAANGIPTADGFADYLTLLNERDGGIGGASPGAISVPIARNSASASLE